ncbi:hypothetical protein L1887_31489 [Cichorium endivia]|nr:hypothetical protein L1887_31489 [Cichorium endivia]
MATNIGMMDAAYLVGRSEILAWINCTLRLNLSKVEEACSGAVHCQLMDAAHPGTVPMNKHIEVKKLIKGTPLDHLEFMQWMKRYYDSVSGRADQKARYLIILQELIHRLPPQQALLRSRTQPYNTSEYDQQITDLKLTIDELEEDKKFYLRKYRDVETFCALSTMSNIPCIETIRRILYSSEDDAWRIIEEVRNNDNKEDEQSKSDTQKRKTIVNDEVDEAAVTAFSPRLRASQASDVHSGGSSPGKNVL